MPIDAPESAIVVRLPIPPALERIRRRWDHAAAAGVPSHVTVLYPFLAPDELVPAVRARVGDVAAAVEPFTVRFGAVGRFPTVVYLAPAPPEPFAALTAAAVAAFPGHLPYGGAFDVVIPHLTLAESVTADLDRIAAEAAARVPFDRRATALEVIVQDPDGRWKPRWRIRLGRGSGRGR
jgi:2'-5' RNA ligase